MPDPADDEEGWRGRPFRRPRLPRTPRTPALLVLGALFPLLWRGPALEAQLLPRGGTPTERQEPLLPDAGILEITPELRSRLGLFPGVPGFRAARLLVGEAGAASVEVEWVEGGRIFRERRPLTPSEVELLRGEMAAALAEAGARGVATREGRGGFVFRQTALGLAYHGWAVPVALDVDSSQGAVAAYLLTAGTSFYLPYRLTRDRGVSPVHRDLSFYGGTRGVLTGLLAGDLVAGGWYDDTDRALRARLAGGVVMGAAGSVAGFAATDRWNPTAGDARFVGVFGDAGLVAGAALGYLAGPYRTEDVLVEGPGFEFTEERMRNRRAGHGITLAGQGAGLALGGWLSTRRSYAPGDAAVLRSATVLGVQAGATGARLAGANEDRGPRWVTGMLVGGSLGLAASDRWIGARGLDGGEGLLVNAGHLAGGATAAGLTYLLVDDMGEAATPLLLASTLGSALGAELVRRAVTGSSPLRRDHDGHGDAGGGGAGRGNLQSAERPSAPPRHRSRFSLTLHPEGVLQGASPALLPASTQERRGGHTAVPTWVTVRF